MTAPADAEFIVEGGVECATCAERYPIRQGVLSLLRGPLHPESATEMRERDSHNEALLNGERGEWSSTFADEFEVRPTLAVMATEPHHVVNELGCGAGRYTNALARSAAAVVAVDLSMSGLQVARRKLDASDSVALVQADVTRQYAPDRVFDRVLSTLHSNLPSPEHRQASLRHVAQSLRDDGRAVISMHHYGLRDRLMAVPASGRYPESGIYRCYLRQPQAVRESQPYFERVRFEYIAASVPGMKTRGVARAVNRTPWLSKLFGRLFLAVSERPRRDSDR